MDPSLSAIIVAVITLIGTIVNAILTFMNGRKLNAVKAQTDGMSRRLEQAAFKDGQDDGKAQAEKLHGPG